MESMQRKVHGCGQGGELSTAKDIWNSFELPLVVVSKTVTRWKSWNQEWNLASMWWL